jgi:hypothetical protein
MDARRARLRYAVLTAVVAGSVAAVSAACVFSKPNVSAEQEACSSIATFLGSCASSSACSSAAAADCSQITATFSDALLNGMITCAQAQQTCDAGSALTSPCAFSNAGAASTVQLQLASDYCAACAPDASSCAGAFYGLGGVGIVEAPAFAATDGIVGYIDETCTSHLDIDAGAAACAEAFVACARPILAAQLFLPGECTGDASAVPPLGPDGG